MASNIPAYGVARYGVARYGSAILDNEIEEDDTINFDMTREITNAINSTDNVYKLTDRTLEPESITTDDAIQKGVILELVEAIYSNDTKTKDIYKTILNSITTLDDFQAQQIVLIIKDLFCSLSIDKLKSSIDRLFDYTASLEIEERSLNIILE